MFNEEFKNNLPDDPWIALKEIHNKFREYDKKNRKNLTESSARQYLIGFIFLKEFSKRYNIEFKQPYPTFDFDNPSQNASTRNAEVIQKIQAFFNIIAKQINDNVNKINLTRTIENEEKKYLLNKKDNENDFLDEKRIRILQEIFDQFMKDGEWPLLRIFEVNQAFGDVRAWLKTMPEQYVRIFNEHQKDAKLILGLLGIKECKGSQSILSEFNEVVQLFKDTYRINPLEPKISASMIAKKLDFSELQKRKIVAILKETPKLWDGISENDLEIEFEISPNVLQFGINISSEVSKQIIQHEGDYKLQLQDEVKLPELDIFICHSSTDGELVVKLVDLLRTALNLSANRIRCTSVDGFRLPVGVNTDEQLRQEVYRSRILIGIITKSSMQSAYVLFELGARWITKKPMFPLLTCSSDSNIISGPLKDINYLCCDKSAQLHQLIDEIADKLKIAKEKTASFQNKIDEIVELSRKRNDEHPNFENENKGEIVLEEGVVWRKKNGSRKGPFCQLCWERDGKLISLYHNMVEIEENESVSIWKCRACSSNYEIDNLEKFL